MHSLVITKDGDGGLLPFGGTELQVAVHREQSRQHLGASRCEEVGDGGGH